MHKKSFLFLVGALLFLAAFALQAEQKDPPEAISLSAAVQKALHGNPSIAVIEARHQAAQSRVREARSGHLPKIAASAGFTRYEEPMTIIPIHQIGVFPPLDDKIYQSAVQLQLPIFTGGRISAATAAAKAGAAELQARVEETHTLVVEQVSLLFVQASELNDRQELVRTTLEMLEQRHREMSVLLAEGRLSIADRALLEAAIESMKSDSLEIQFAIAQVRLRLGQWLGDDRPIVPLIDNSLFASRVDSAETADLFQEPTLVASAQMKQAQARLNRSLAGQSLATRSFFPDLSAFSVYQVRSGADDWDPLGEWALGVTLNIPLFEGGKRLANRQAAQAEVRAAVQGLESVRQQQNADLSLAAQQWQNSRQAQEFFTRAVENKELFVQAQRNLYDTGRLPLSELLTQETEWLGLKFRQKSQRYNEIRALLRYHAVAGTLNENNLTFILGGVQ